MRNGYRIYASTCTSSALSMHNILPLTPAISGDNGLPIQSVFQHSAHITLCQSPYTPAISIHNILQVQCIHWHPLLILSCQPCLYSSTHHTSRCAGLVCTPAHITSCQSNLYSSILHTSHCARPVCTPAHLTSCQSSRYSTHRGLINKFLEEGRKQVILVTFLFFNIKCVTLLSPSTSGCFGRSPKQASFRGTTSSFNVSHLLLSYFVKV